MSDLPISSLLPDIIRALQERDKLVLEAPPGAGKTTLVPLALLDADVLRGEKILMLEPRRLAARAAAERMADLLGEPVGKTVGFRVRLESKVSAQTRIEVITEGILGRMLQEDPSLEGVGLVIFDEFHERSLEADVGLVLCLESHSLFAELRSSPLKILIMSATLDGGRIAQVLGDAALLRSEGRQFPVDLCYSGSGATARGRSPDSVVHTVNVIVDVWQRHQGSLLVFLPGQGEIHRCMALLEETLPGAHCYPLYGTLALDAQRRAVQPAPGGARKIVLATSLAESSLTIEGISVVVDAGLQRRAVFDPVTGMSRLQTRRVSSASAAQRAGRAGRLGPGHCYRLWSETEQAALAEFDEPEILRADLVGITLQMLHWGVADFGALTWLDAPPPAHVRQSRDMLRALNALDDNGLTAHGERMATLPVHPRIAHMLLGALELDDEAGEARYAMLACDLAAITMERDFLDDAGSDIELRLLALKGDYPVPRGRGAVLQRISRQQAQFRRMLGVSVTATALPARQGEAAALLALAYPDRIAMQRKAGGIDYLLSNGRSARLSDGDTLRGSPWLAVAETGGRQGQDQDRIFLAAALDERVFDGVLRQNCETRVVCEWDERQQRFIAERQTSVGAITLRSETLVDVPAEQKNSALIGLLQRRGLSVLNWTDSALQLRCRVEMLRELDADAGLPDYSETGLRAALAQWLGPYLGPVRTLADFKKLDCAAILMSELTWQQRQRLDTQLPARITVPSGSAIAIDYTASPPVLAVKLQEMFGCDTTPVLAGGRIELMVHLLSPARRPLQITQDLAGFWRGSYQQVKKEMKGRYPKHPWPDNPLEASPSARTKPRG